MKKSVGRVVSCLQSILLPHMLFSSLYHNHLDKFIKYLCGGDLDNIKAFWAAMGSHPAYNENHPVKRAGLQEVAIPLSLHGDGVPVAGVQRSWSKSVDVYSWCSLLSKSATLESNFLIFMLYWKLLADNTVWEAVARKIHWSFYWLAVGKWPVRDEYGNKYTDLNPSSEDAQRAGQPLAGGYCGVLWIMRCDLEHAHKAYALPFHGRPSNPCALCSANDSDRPWTDARPEGALWTHTIWTNEQWHDKYDTIHKFFKLPGMGVLAFIPDIMHTLHLGCYCWIFGSILKFCTHHIMPGSCQANLEALWLKIDEYYKVHRSFRSISLPT